MVLADDLRRHVASASARLRDSIIDDTTRVRVLFLAFNLILGSVSLFMTAVNVVTARWLLMGSTLAFSLACFLNVLLSRKSERLAATARYLFLLEGLVLCFFFCVTGTPEGFSALWTCFIPSFALTLLGRKGGTLYAAAGFVMIAAVFWTPFGRSLLLYDYTGSFMLRFPMIYLAFYVMAFFLEAVRAETKNQLVKTKSEYQYLYKHDALTGLYNRYGFNEQLDEVFAGLGRSELSLAIMDIDYFKRVNDTYGHAMGDEVLRAIARCVSEVVGDEGYTCRWGGEEFTALAVNDPDPVALAERIRSSVQDLCIETPQGPLSVSVSVGLCVARRSATTTIGQIVRTADQCLYEAKEEGRNRVRWERVS